MKLLLVVVMALAVGIEAAEEKAIKVKDKQMMRQMIIYDKVGWRLQELKLFLNISLTF